MHRQTGIGQRTELTVTSSPQARAPNEIGLPNFCTLSYTLEERIIVSRQRNPCRGKLPSSSSNSGFPRSYNPKVFNAPEAEWLLIRTLPTGWNAPMAGTRGRRNACFGACVPVSWPGTEPYRFLTRLRAPFPRLPCEMLGKYVSRHLPLARVHIAMNECGCSTYDQKTYELRQKNRLRIGPLIRRTGDKAWKKISFNG